MWSSRERYDQTYKMRTSFGKEKKKKTGPRCVKNRADDMRKLFSPFGTRTEQYVKVKRENESEWGDCTKAEIE